MLDLQGYEASILKGALLTIEVAVLSLLLAMLLGMLGALAKMAPYRWLEPLRHSIPLSFAVFRI